MRIKIYLVCLSVLLSSPLRAEKLPVEVFANPPAFTDMTLSRDGKFVAYKAEYEDAERVFIRELETKKVQAVEMPSNATNFYGRIGGMSWISEKRLLIRSYMGYVAIDNDGDDYKMLTGPARTWGVNRQDNQRINAGSMIYSSRDTESDRVLVNEYDQAVGDMRTGFTKSAEPNVISLDTRSGFFMRELENPGGVVDWVPDREGQIRLGVKVKGIKIEVMYRDDENAPWRILKGLGDDPLEVIPLGFSYDGKQIYVSKISSDGRFAVYPYDPASDQLGESLLEHGLYDIGPTNFGGPVSAPDGRLIGIRYYTEVARVFWLDPVYRGIQEQIDAAIPKSINRITSISNDEQHLLVFASSAQNPGTYYFFDRTNNTIGKFVDVMPWVDPEKMAEKLPLKIKARDGLMLRGYLTVPPGKERKNLPLVVLVHGGPWARDTYGFDPQVQFMANRGYAVLQINYRGSTGYGRDFYKKGFRVVGTAMQEDIEDATRWTMARGIADPKRVAIMGGSFGGYSTLMGLIRTPDLYCCGIDVAGVTNWIDIIKHGGALNPTGFAFNVDRIGDPVKDAEALRAISPVFHVDRIQSPLLIVHGRDDDVVPYDQAKDLVEALDKAGKSYEMVAKFNEPHGIYNYKNRIDFYKQVEAFLTKHMPADY
jgi:dipeptidyl aminopeptidase/acylaminoacyl peptidase|uniref:alpha/beta hydrolase family protein n=1 Tax=Cephaloticoccus sp. TaxID=1985742 RepID=UPI00404962C7